MARGSKPTENKSLAEALGGLPSLTTAGVAAPVPAAPPAAPVIVGAKPAGATAPLDLSAIVADGVKLTDAEKAKLHEEVRAELLAEARAEAAEDYKKQLRIEATRKSLKHATDEEDDDAVELMVDLARTVPYLRLDNVVYYPGYKYWVSPSVAKVIKDQMYRSYLHDAEISGLNINEYLGRQHALSIIRPN